MTGRLEGGTARTSLGHSFTAEEGPPGPRVLPSGAPNAGLCAQCTQGSRALLSGAGNHGAQSPGREMLREEESLLLKSDPLSASASLRGL